jgi:DNA-binding response OmpR family regulator
MARTVLIIEDDENYREPLKQKLTAESYTVYATDDGEEAMKILETSPVDLILLDLMMPKMSGATFIEQLYQKYKTKFPVVVLTNVPVQQQHPTVVDYYVKSNISINDLVAMVDVRLKELGK